MTQNFESSLERAAGEYIVMIGDDAGLSRWVWDCIALAKIHDADILVTKKISLHYYWPDFTVHVAQDVEQAMAYLRELKAGMK